MSLKKQYSKTKPVCKVSFTLSKEQAKDAVHASVAGDFNNWDYTANPMKKAKDGSFSATLELEKGKEYEFRYLLNESHIENDMEADKLVPSGFGNSENSVVVV